MLERLAAYDWPGNVRELRNVIERATILAGEGTISRQHLPQGLGGKIAPPRASADGNELRIAVGHNH